MTPTLTAESTVATRMTHRPIAVAVDASFHDIAAVLSGNRIGAVPVLGENGQLVGVVSELDLIQAGLRAPRGLAELTARELMTSRPVTVGPDAPLSTAARLLGEAGVRRLFVVEGGRLVGVMSRGDLVRGDVIDDLEIRDQIEQAGLPRDAVVRAVVENGVVLLVGRVRWHSDLARVEAVVGAVPGVIEVRNRMRYVWDDRARRSGR